MEVKKTWVDVCNKFYDYTYFNEVKEKYGINPHWEGAQNTREVYTFSDAEMKHMT